MTREKRTFQISILVACLSIQPLFVGQSGFSGALLADSGDSEKNKEKEEKNAQSRTQPPVAHPSQGSLPACVSRAVIANTGQAALNGNVMVDSYQSSAGDYGANNRSKSGDVQAALAVKQNGNVR